MKIPTLTFILTLISQTMIAQTGASPLTVGQVMQLIRQNARPQWVESKTDTIVVGNAFDAVTGISTCMFVDMEILKRSVANKCNLIVTHEPTFYEGSDKIPAFLKDDPVLTEKMKYIMEHHLTIFRLHDNGHRMKPDQVMQGLADELGWKVVQQSPWILEVNKQSLSSVANEVKKHFGVDGIRVIGNPDLQITRVGLVPGMAPSLQMHLGTLQREDVDAILVGEAREWEDYVYVKDAVVQGRKKGAIFMGHLKSEESGMKYCATWLKTFIKDINVTFLESKNYWWVPR
jgi:putative NIF3 family GTP cyclohydrolase 1 type 2